MTIHSFVRSIVNSVEGSQQQQKKEHTNDEVHFDIAPLLTACVMYILYISPNWK